MVISEHISGDGFPSVIPSPRDRISGDTVLIIAAEILESWLGDFNPVPDSMMI